jgi:hypothetical protein
MFRLYVAIIGHLYFIKVLIKPCIHVHLIPQYCYKYNYLMMAT